MPSDRPSPAHPLGDTHRVGMLYGRLIDQLLRVDIERQVAARTGAARDTHLALHPWYPVALIAREKAALHAHPGHGAAHHDWLMRVSAYLELLTFLGIVEAVKQELGDLLTHAERAAVERSEPLGRLLEHVDADGWRRVWGLRRIAWDHELPVAGRVSPRNMLRKRTTTLCFLEAHHRDLTRALELAGPNHVSAQDAWRHVFRDAEHALVRTMESAFPELWALPVRVRELVLWHRPGGLLPSAAASYRASMNAVAAWAMRRGLMSYRGSECIPVEISVLESRMPRADALATLQVPC
jgi:hypothetical protein